MTQAQRERKINKLSRIHDELTAEARNGALTRSDRMALARASDALNDAIKKMEAAR